MSGLYFFGSGARFGTTLWRRSARCRASQQRTAPAPGRHDRAAERLRRQSDSPCGHAAPEAVRPRRPAIECLACSTSSTRSITRTTGPTRRGEQRELRPAVVQQQHRLSGADGAAGIPARLLSVGHIRRLPSRPPHNCLVRDRSDRPIDRETREEHRIHSCFRESHRMVRRLLFAFTATHRARREITGNIPAWRSLAREESS